MAQRTGADTELSGKVSLCQPQAAAQLRHVNFFWTVCFCRDFLAFVNGDGFV
jgi:hypothetical protein